MFENSTLTHEAEGYLIETSKWARFLSVIGFIFTGMIIIAGLGLALSSGFIGMGVAGVGMGVFYLLLGVFYLMPTLFLFRFADGISNAMKTGSETELTKGFGNLKSCFKFMGIFTIVGIALYVILIIAMVFIGAGGFLGGF